MSAPRLPRQATAVALTLVAGALRLLTNALAVFNFNPIYAGCTFGSARLKGPLRYVLPILLWTLGDVLFWAQRSYDPEYLPVSQVWWWINMLSLGMFMLIGRFVIGESRSWGRIGAASVLGPVQFFLITNFGSWLTIADYPKTLSGLAYCYEKGLEFLGPTLLASLFTPLWFAVHEYLTRPAVAPQTEPAAEAIPVISSSAD